MRFLPHPVWPPKVLGLPSQVSGSYELANPRCRKSNIKIKPEMDPGVGCCFISNDCSWKGWPEPVTSSIQGNLCPG